MQADFRFFVACLLYTSSSGSMLIGTDHGSQLVDALAKEGIHASVIGKAVEGNDRVIFNDGDVYKRQDLSGIYGILCGW